MSDEYLIQDGDVVRPMTPEEVADLELIRSTMYDPFAE